LRIGKRQLRVEPVFFVFFAQDHRHARVDVCHQLICRGRDDSKRRMRPAVFAMYRAPDTGKGKRGLDSG
jgi:hypothetical protein